MNNNSKKLIFLIVGAVLFIALIAGAVILYNSLKKDSKPEQVALDYDEFLGGNVSQSSKPTPVNPDNDKDTDSDNTSDTDEKDTVELPDSDKANDVADEKIDEDISVNEEENSVPEIPAPDFTVEDGDGNKVSLSDFKGKPVVVNFWASWCPPCKEEMPDFEKLYKEYGDEVVFMMVNLTDGYQETKADADAHISSKGYTFPVYYDTELDAAMTYGVSAVPVTFFVDKNGGFVMGYRGMLDYDTVLDGIKQITE